nr:ABC transporter substrate binding protein [Bradyrhizobium sp. AUGA SZCCT0177]
MDIIAVTGAVTARAAKKAVKNIPIVFAVVVDPVADNVVANLERPGGNLTGTTSFDPQQAKKQLESPQGGDSWVQARGSAGRSRRLRGLD